MDCVKELPAVVGLCALCLAISGLGGCETQRDVERRQAIERSADLRWKLADAEYKAAEANAKADRAQIKLARTYFEKPMARIRVHRSKGHVADAAWASYQSAERNCEDAIMAAEGIVGKQRHGEFKARLDYVYKLASDLEQAAKALRLEFPNDVK